MIQPVNKTTAALVSSCVQRAYGMLEWYNLSIKLQLPSKQVVYEECTECYNGTTLPGPG